MLRLQVGHEKTTGGHGAVMVVHLAFATLLAQTTRREGSYGKMKLPPIAKAKRDLLGTPASQFEEAAQVCFSIRSSAIERG